MADIPYSRNDISGARQKGENIRALEPNGRGDRRRTQVIRQA